MHGPGAPVLLAAPGAGVGLHCLPADGGMASFPAQKARDVNLSSKLEALRARNAAIDAVVYVDFGATTVLGTSQSAGRPQEDNTLARVSAAAIRSLGTANRYASRACFTFCSVG